jgi:hypothetical protein
MAATLEERTTAMGEASRPTARSCGARSRTSSASPDVRRRARTGHHVKTPRGWVQGYNAQAVCTEQIVIAAEITIDSPDVGHLEPMVTATETELAAAGVGASPEVVLADAGYWHQAQMQRIADRGIEILIPPDAGKRKGGPAGTAAFTHACASGSRPIAAASSTPNATA